MDKEGLSQEANLLMRNIMSNSKRFATEHLNTVYLKTNYLLSEITKYIILFRPRKLSKAKNCYISFGKMAKQLKTTELDVMQGLRHFISYEKKKFIVLQRIVKNGETYYSEQYQRVKKRILYVVSLRNDDSSHSVASIIYFVMEEQERQVFAMARLIHRMEKWAIECRNVQLCNIMRVASISSK